ncbi:dethiobiotin synthase [uncultured Peptoniphilus sp.]|uniref:dethiobiotin synthase n=1 Tax=uncultured Peptoniphilus sp. TaxID=254354 RepID=UPI002803FE48|nr:dethiobiotin synthase [uncultured Peptoniphilus sp.]
MSKSIFITGTGTDIGKTYIAALIVKKLKEYGFKSAYYKAAMSENIKNENGKLIPGDAKFVKDMAEIEQSLDEMCPYVYERAVSPHLASKIEGNPVDLKVAKENYESIKDKYDYITLEGSGGILCPLRFDDKKIFLEDFIKACKLSSILVADTGLGTINDIALTAFYMKEKGLNLKAIIFNNYIEGDIMQEDNIKMCEYLTGLKVIACVKKGDTDIDISKELFESLYE